MQSIVTKYHGPGNLRGSRISATASGGGGRVSVAYSHRLNAEENHDAAARALALKMGWRGQMVRGALKSGHVYVFADGERITVGGEG